VAGRRIAEFPLAVTPGLRLPVYHTLRYFGPPAGFERRLDGFAARGELLSYVLHGVDVLGLEEDGVDARLAVHPGMRWPRARKQELLAATLARLTERFASRPYAEVLPAGV
jgi:hypothetical protein